MKSDISETVIATCVVSARLILSFKPIVRRKPHLVRINRFPFIETTPVLSTLFSIVNIDIVKKLFTLQEYYVIVYIISTDGNNKQYDQNH